MPRNRLFALLLLLSVGAARADGEGTPKWVASWATSPATYLTYAAPLAFIALSVPFLRDRAMIAAALAAGLVVIAAHGLPFRLYIVAAAFIGIAAGLLFERKAA